MVDRFQKNWPLAIFTAIILAGCGGEQNKVGNGSLNNVDETGSETTAPVDPNGQAPAAGEEPSTVDTSVPPVVDVTGQEEPASVAYACAPDHAGFRAALLSGDANQIESDEVILNETLGLVSCLEKQFDVAFTELFELNPDGTSNTTSLTSISWEITHDSALLRPIPGETQSLFLSNDTWRTDGRVDNAPLAVIGQQGDSRQITMGGNPFRNFLRSNNALSPDMHQFMRNSLQWLTAREELAESPLNVVIAQMDQSYYFPDYNGTAAWLDAELGDQLVINELNDCDDAALAGCLDAQPDLLVISGYSNSDSTGNTISTVQSGIDRGLPVLYLHWDGGQTDLSRGLLPLLDVQFSSDNYWSRQRLTEFNPTAIPTDHAPEFSRIKNLLTAFRDDTLPVDLSLCSNHTCEPASGYETEFLNVVLPVQARLESMDKAGQRLFEQKGRHIDKALVLLADRFRQNVSFPMDKMTTPGSMFLKSLYADRVNPLLRDINPVQTDMGNHSRSDFSHITPVNKTVAITARDRYKAAGVYAIPGQTVTVSRTDNEDVNTVIKVNLIRSGATHEFDESSYNRPKFVTSQDLPIKAGETVSFTTPYGGPIQIGFDRKDVVTHFRFENVGEHAVWRSSEDDTDFSYKLAADEYDWAELITRSFQVHSTLSKMQETVAGEFWGSAAAVGAGTETYMHNYPHVLAGFKGTGIDVVDEVHEFAANNGLTIHTLDKVKHMNADQALCGYGCSGNPYDAYWSFNPLGHGDLHELGHGLERNRFRFSGQPNHAVTNPYSYYSKWRFAQETGRDVEEIGCQSLPYERLFGLLQASRGTEDPGQYMRDQNLTTWQDGAAINQQMMMAAQNLGVLNDGRMLLARLHVIDREFNHADNNEASWAASKDGLGFGSYTLEQAASVSNDDWNLIAISHALSLDMRDYLYMWGFEFSDTAKAQVESLRYSPMPLVFYMTGDKAHCDSFDALSAQSVDGTSAWAAQP